MRKLLCAAVFSLIIGTPLHGQVELALSPLVGGYVPTAKLFEVLVPRQIANVGQEPGPLFGGRIALRFTRLAIEAEAGYAHSNLDLPEAALAAGLDDGASVFLGSVNILYDIFQAPLSPLSLHLSAGTGLVARSGRELDRFEGTTGLAGALGVGARLGLSPLTSLRFDLRDYISSFSPSTRDGVDLGAQFQNDLILTVGLELTFTTPGR